MKTIFALCFASLLISAMGAAAAADILDLTISDSAATSGNLPITFTPSSGTATTIKTSGASGLQKLTLSTTATAVADNTYTVTWTGGLPLISTYQGAVETSPAPATPNDDFVLLKLFVSDRFVTIAGASTQTTKDAAASNVGSGATFTKANNCGDYILDSLNGVATIFVDDLCTVTVTQGSGVVGALQYNVDTLSTAQQQQITDAISKAANGVSGVSGATTTIIGTASGSIIAYYAVNGLTKDQAGSVSDAVASVIAAKSITVTGATQLNGFAASITPANNAGNDVPKTAANADLAANVKSHSRMVVIAGVFTTVLAAFFGLAF